jgi:hypothetical protein
MKITELVVALEALKAEHGDVEVTMNHRCDGEAVPLDTDGISYTPSNAPVAEGYEHVRNTVYLGY